MYTLYCNFVLVFYFYLQGNFKKQYGENVFYNYNFENYYNLLLIG